MTDAVWIERALVSSRPQAVAALLRYFRDLDAAEEAYQDACLRALKTWPVNGPPRNPAAWLIMVGRNATLDGVRRRSKQAPLPDEALISDLEDQQTDLAERLDDSQYRDDVLRLLFVCCHPDLPPTQQIAMALRIVSGLTVPQIARAFLVSEAAMEQRITRAKAKVAAADVPFETPGPVERSERLGAVMKMIYLVFNEGYSAGPKDADRSQLADEAIRLGRLLLRMFQPEPEVMGLLALMLLQHSRLPARFDTSGEAVLLEDQDRSLWRAEHDLGGARPDRQGHAAPADRALSGAGGDCGAACAGAALRRDRLGGDRCALCHAGASSAVSGCDAQPRGGGFEDEGPEAALAMIDPLAPQLAGYFHFHGARGGLLLQLGRGREAREAFDRAIGLAGTVAEAAHIRMHIDRLIADSGKDAQ